MSTTEPKAPEDYEVAEALALVLSAGFDGDDLPEPLGGLICDWSHGVERGIASGSPADAVTSYTADVVTRAGRVLRADASIEVGVTDVTSEYIDVDGRLVHVDDMGVAS